MKFQRIREKRIVSNRLAVMRNIRDSSNGTKNFNRRFSLSLSLSSFRFAVSPLFFCLLSFFSNAFHVGRNSTESNISHRNGRTISTFSELIIGSAIRVPRGCQSLQIHRDLLVKSTGDVCMKIHVNIQLCTLTICKFPGN